MNPNFFPLRALLALVMLLGTTTLGAQDFPYVISLFSEPYVPLGENALDYQRDAGGDLGSGRPLVITTMTGTSSPFTFLGHGADSFHIYPRGAVSLLTRDTGWTGQLGVLMSDWVPRSWHISTDETSRLRFSGTGGAGNRVMTIEWKNLTLKGDNPDNGFDSVNYQLWLYEGANMIEVRIGPNHVTSAYTNFDEPISGPILALYQAPSQYIPEPIGAFYTGNPDAPAKNVWSLATPFGALQGFPSEGTVYRFTFSGSAGAAYAGSNFRGIAAVPNPATFSTTIRFGLDRAAECQLLLRDALGNRVREMQLGYLPAGEQSARLLTEGLAAGLYFYTLHANSKRMSGCVAIQ
jgi:hypothetical protein